MPPPLAAAHRARPRRRGGAIGAVLLPGVMCLLAAACGGPGGGVASTPTTSTRPAAPPTTDTVPGGAHPQPGFDAGWHQIAEADFSSDEVDPSRWGVYRSRGERGPGAPGVGARGGVLQLITTGGQGAGLCWCRDRPTSLYGRWEVRERLSPGAGRGAVTLLWPVEGHWPADGEIDFAEINDPRRSATTATVHFTAGNERIAATSPGDFTAWHTFAVEWEPTDIKVWVDDDLVFTTTDRKAIPDHPMFLAIQDGPNTPDPPASSSDLQVAWVKVFAP